MGQKASQYQWAAVACSDLLEIATQLTPDEFKLYFIILALVRRNEGEPGHEFNSLRATRRMLRHFFGPVTLNRLGCLAHRLHDKGFIRITPAPGCRLFIVLDFTVSVAPVRMTLSHAARGSVFRGRSSVPPGRPPAGPAHPNVGTPLPPGEDGTPCPWTKEEVEAEAAKASPSVKRAAAGFLRAVRLKGRREEEKVPKRRREEKRREVKRSEAKRGTPLPPGGEELTLPQPQGIPRLFSGLTALLCDSGLRAHLSEVEANFDLVLDEKLRRQVAVSMNSFLCAKGHFAIKNWPAFSAAYVKRSLTDERKGRVRHGAPVRHQGHLRARGPRGPGPSGSRIDAVL